MAYRIETVKVKDSPMEVFLFSPAGEGPHPGIVLCQHIPVGHTGVENDTVTLATAQRYADNGYAVAVPFIFHWWPKTAEMQQKRDEFRDDWTELDLKAAFDLLAKQPGVDAKRVAVVGHCWGGRVAWLGAASDPRYAACAIFYGGRVKAAMGPGTPPAIELAPKIPLPGDRLFRQRGHQPGAGGRRRLRRGAHARGSGAHVPPLRRRGARVPVVQ